MHHHAEIIPRKDPKLPKEMKVELLYLGADYPVSRLKLCEGGGYDAAIKIVAGP